MAAEGREVNSVLFPQCPGVLVQGYYDFDPQEEYIGGQASSVAGPQIVVPDPSIVDLKRANHMPPGP